MRLMIALDVRLTGVLLYRRRFSQWTQLRGCCYRQRLTFAANPGAPGRLVHRVPRLGTDVSPDVQAGSAARTRKAN